VWWTPNTGGNISGKQIISKRGAFCLAFMFIAVYVATLAFFARATVAEVQPVRPVVTHCHKVTPQTYNKQVRKLDKITGRRHHKASRRVCKHGPYLDVGKRITKLCRPIHVVTGRTSVFNDSGTYTGISAASNEGLAININPGTDSGWSNATVRHWADTGQRFLVKLLGRQRWTRIIDLGPAGWVNRALDFSQPLASAMGFGSNFPTDSVGSLWRVRNGCK
jgi:hypothetical protein